MRRSFAIALTLALALPAAGAEPDVRAVVPFLDEQTLAVARLDPTKADAVTLATTLTDLGVIDADETQDVKTRAGRWLDDWTKAGGKDLYVVFSLADYPSCPFVVVPLGEGADAQALAGLIDFPQLPVGPREKVGDVVFAGSRAARERLRALKPEARPELARVLAAAGDGAAQVALVPPAHLARVIEELMPTLPREVGGGPSKVLTRGTKWAALGLDVRPRTALRLTVQSPDAASAKALAEALPALVKSAALPAPTVAEDRLTLALDGPTVRSKLGPLVRRAMQAAARAESVERLHKLVIAMHNHQATYGHLPAVASFDKDGKPLLSWRVQLLPYLGEEALYKEFHLDEPWDSEHNKKLITRMPAVFRGPSRRLNEQGKTVYLAPVGPQLAFTGTPTARRLNTQEFSDGTARTILFVEADPALAVEWTKPEDLKIDPAKPDAGLARQGGRFLVMMVDGSERQVKATVRKETLWAAFTVNGGEKLDDNWWD